MDARPDDGFWFTAVPVTESFEVPGYPTKGICYVVSSGTATMSITAQVESVQNINP